jgi:ribonuclease T2
LKVLSDALDPLAKRSLHWDGGDNPIPAPFAAGTFQPLYGMNTALKPLYQRTLVVNATGSCVVPMANDFCKAATRNFPAENWEPAFVVWPLTTAHVQTAVKFARSHQLCVSVAGTGHDFLNRHSCNNGLMIRTTLLKSMDWTLDGVVKLGSGLTFSEINKASSEQKPAVFIATGWASTVGVAGWSIGGGHGPIVPSTGAGVDNLVEAEIVLANGSLVTANANNHPDLYWAVRGGGGSTWGLITTLTVRKHGIPEGGFSRFTTTFGGNMSGTSEVKLSHFIDHIFDWALGLDEKWGGLMFVTGGKSWSVELVYWYTGNTTDTDFHAQTAKVSNGPIKPQGNQTDNYANWWLGNLPQQEKSDPIETWVIPFKTTGDKIPSALLNRSVVGGTKFRSQMKSWFQDCSAGGCGVLELYQALPHPQSSKHFPVNGTSVSPGWSNGVIHFISPTDKQSRQRFVPLANNAYFAESAYNHDGDSWKQRYWGPNYDRLLAIKQKYDPDNFFWCHNCVGSDLPRAFSTASVSRRNTLLMV